MTMAEEYHPQQTPMGSPTPSRESPFTINRVLLPVKGYYFVFMAAVGDLLPFLAVYMRHLGLTPKETGIIYGVMPFVGFFMRPLIGAFADKYLKHKLVLMVVTVLTGVFYVLLITVPQRPALQLVSVKTTLMCNTQDSYFQDCDNSYTDDSCAIGFSRFSNTSFVKSLNETTSCALVCKVMEEDPSEFEACFTNETNPLSFSKCVGSVSKGNILKFNVTNINSILSSVDLQHMSHGCKDFDLKDVFYDKEAFQVLCNREQELDCTMTCPVNSEKEYCGKSPEAFDKSFFIFFFLFLMANIFFSPIFPILDAATYDCLGEKRHLWGKQRIWGTFGFALFAITSTFIMMYVKNNNNDDVNYSISFYNFGPLCLIAAVFAYFIRFSSDIRCGQFVKNVWKLLSYKEVSVFLLVIMYFGIVLGGLEAFLFWYLIGLQSPPLIFGLMLVVNCLAEMPMLWLAGSIIKNIGLVSCLYLALICCGLRLMAYSLLENPWFVLLVEPVHGVTFALMYAAASSYASIISPPGMSATVQGLLGGVHFGFGKGIGSLITGFLYDGIGPRWTWGFFALVSVVILIIYVLLNVFVFTHRHPATDQNKPPDDNEECAMQEDQLMDNGLSIPASEGNTVA